MDKSLIHWTACLQRSDITALTIEKGEVAKSKGLGSLTECLESTGC